MPSLHSPVVSTMVPSMSMRADSKNARAGEPRRFCRIVEDVEQRMDILGPEASANRRPWWDRECASSEAVEEDFVLARSSRS